MASLLEQIPPELLDYVNRRRAAPDPAALDAALAKDRETEGVGALAQNLGRSAALYRGEKVGPAVSPVPDAVKEFMLKQQLAKPDDPLARLDTVSGIVKNLRTGEKASDPGNEPAPPEWNALPGMTKAQAIAAGYAKKGEGTDVLEPELVDRAKKAGVPTSGRKREPVIADILASERADRERRDRDAKDKAPKAVAPEDLRKEFQNHPTVKDTQALASMYGKITSASESGAGDIALIFGYMKMLDPGSTVREGEYATAANAGSVPQSIVAAYNKIVSGEKLSPGVRQSFRSEAGRLYNAQVERYGRVADEYRRLAQQSGLDPKNVVLDIGYEPPKQAAPATLTRPAGVPDSFVPYRNKQTGAIRWNEPGKSHPAWEAVSG